ncbi:DUF7144 family membrane protein [Glycomyces paridis]|uniref:DUF7144 domain-containing protein n=1 Tax=Glycomyces paridis TaxID=2126555 RepID=A0A4S8PMH5_9ACTN|nr:hypothetical protein [Glycomyces paridis]THV30842.1 hypothetical protein E9998_05565 [Glycomyces paridis]
MTHSPESRAWAIGGWVFAASAAIVMGIWQIIEGIAAVANDGFLIETENYTYNLDTTAWGWIHIVLGALVLIVGFMLFSGSGFARFMGIFLACLVAINNFFFLPYYPLWSLIVIALAIFVIWSLATADPKDL